MTDAIEVPWDALEKFAATTGAAPHLLLEAIPALPVWIFSGRLDGTSDLRGLSLEHLLAMDSPAIRTHHAALRRLTRVLPNVSSSVHRVRIHLSPGIGLLRSDDPHGNHLIHARPRPGAIRLGRPHSIQRLRPSAKATFSAWAKQAPDGLDVEARGSAHARLHALSMLPESLRDLDQLWPDVTRPHLRVVTWPGIAALIAVHQNHESWREDVLLFAAKRGHS